MSMARLRRVGLQIGLVAALIPACAGWPEAMADDRHEGYYYPEVTSRETYRARSKVQPDIGRAQRLAFIVGHAAVQRGRAYPPRYALFAKGTDAEKLIIVGLDEASFATLYRARGVLAQLTAVARGTELFRNLSVEDYFTFFDLARMLGFEQITVTDGYDFAHQITLE